MKSHSKTPLVVCLAMIATLAISGAAEAILITSAGVWENPLGTAFGVMGTGTNTISWGIPPAGPPPGDPSSWVFDGVTDLMGPADPDGFVFKLGTFTHNNNVILEDGVVENFEGADLVLDIGIANGNIFNGQFIFAISHDETPNDPPCDPDLGPPCADVVGIPSTTAMDLVEINGMFYRLSILGFADLPAGPFINDFVTIEGDASSTMLFGRLDKVTVPEPATLTLLGAGLFALLLGSGRPPRKKA